MPLLIYTFGILKWTQTELDTLDCKVRKLLRACRMYHPRSSVMRLYIPRKCGGRGLLNAKNLHNLDKSLTPLFLGKENWRMPNVLNNSDRVAVWKSKELHGRFYKALSGPDVDQIASVSWLQFGDLFGETEDFLCAIMDEVIKTRNYRNNIMKDGTLVICRACHRPGESLRHIVSGCSHLANGEYLHSDNQVARIVHQQLALRFGLIDFEMPYYEYDPASVFENSSALLYWDRTIITDGYITANRSDIVLFDRSVRRAIIVDTIPHDDNLVKAEKEKVFKYLDLAHDITAMWNVESTVIRSSREKLRPTYFKLSLGCWIKGRIQKAVVLETARIVRRFLTLEP
ncbi:jg12947 [Pararge aegeria aegeria]|uniref:Jg12947 protein n=1 Tax=Pararge aegeria aegeria TaxID=348720 RepID=A0A8S4SL07_9NEOP|nr:jg12947 [Pararge aegeria aegeria]